MLVFATKKLSHSFLSHEIYLIVHDNPIPYLVHQPVLSSRVAQWLLNLIEFDIKCVTQKTMKGQALAELLFAHPPKASTPTQDAFNVGHITSTTWVPYYDGSTIGLRGGTDTRGGASVVLMEPSVNSACMLIA